MKLTMALLALGLAGCSHGGSSKNAHTGPDFVSGSPKSSVDPDLVASTGENRNEPLDVLAFAHDKTDLTPAIMSQIDKAAQWLDKHPDRTVVLEGHTDMIGSKNYNEDLSIRRIQAVRQRLVDSKISNERIVSIAYGEKDSIDPENPNDRRVVMFSSKDEPKKVVETQVGARKVIVANWSENGELKEVTPGKPNAAQSTH